MVIRHFVAFQIVHPSILSKFELHKKDVAKKRTAPDGDDSVLGPIAKQKSLEHTSVFGAGRSGHIPQSKVDQPTNM